MDLSDFQYELPERAIAQTPIEPRHASRLLRVADMSDHTFLDLPESLDPGDLVIVNRTRVRHARLIGVKHPTGGAVEALLLGRLADGSWDALVKPARRIRTGTVMEFGGIEAVAVSDPVHGLLRLDLSSQDDIEAAISGTGEVPLPPYITTTLADPSRYQTIFADRVGSAAAPTAGLHFTDAVVQGLRDRGIEMASIELEVGIGTFRPISTARIEDHVMHTERYDVTAETADSVASARERGGRVVAIGTTVVRTLETVGTPDGLITPGRGESDLYLTPGSRFNVVDRLVTNFHLPGSSLLVLLAAFMGPGWRGVYETALERGYRFLSFGDAMLCDRR